MKSNNISKRRIEFSSKIYLFSRQLKYDFSMNHNIDNIHNIALANKIINVLILAHQKLESIWILAPTLVLLKIGVPSLLLLYLGDDAVNCSVTLGVNARQWYWRYEYSDFLSPEFNSSLEFHSSIISAKNTIPISLEFLNFNWVGLISYFFTET